MGVDNKICKLLLAANASGKSLGRSAQNLYLSFNFIFFIFVLALWLTDNHCFGKQGISISLLY